MSEARGEGLRQRVGAADFGSESVSACYGDTREAVPLTAICWVYRRRITRWAISSYVPLPVEVTHELVLHTLYGPGQVWHWRQLGSSNSASAGAAPCPYQ